MISFLKEFNGSIPEAVENARKMGLILDKDAIQAADKFGDTLDLISLQARTTAASFALEFAPAITDGMNEVSKFLTANRGTIREWGKAVGDELMQIENEIKARGNDFQAVGEVIAEKIGEGLEIGLEKTAELAGGYLSKRLVEIFTKGQIVDPISEAIFSSIGRGFTDGLGLTKPEVRIGAKIDTSALDSPELKNAKKLLEDVQKSAGDLKKTIGGMPSIADKIKLDKAEDDAKKAEAQYKILAQTIGNLGLQVSYFGDESEVARVSQQLLSQGITDLNSGLGRAALAWAGQLDNLKKAKKEQDDYNGKLKDWRKTLADFRDKAYADALTPNPTDLQRFDQFLAGAKDGMKDLRAEAEATRDALKWSADYKGFLDGQKRFDDLSGAIAGTARELARGAESVSPFESKLYDLAKAANLVKSAYATLPQTTLGTKTSFYLDDENFVAKSKDFLQKYEEEAARFGAAVKILDAQVSVNNPAAVTDRIFDAMSAAQVKGNQSLAKLTDGYKAYLKSLNTLDKEGKETPLFQADYQIETFIDQLRNLGRAAQASELKTGLESFDKALEGVGLRIGDVGTSTGLEKLDKWFADAGVSQAIEVRAKELGYTADQLREIMRQAQIGKDLDISRLTRPRVVGAPAADPFAEGKADHPLQAGFFENIGLEKFKTDADMYGATFEKMGQMGADAFNGLADAIGSSVEQWVLYGDASGESAKKAIASALAATSAQATASAIMETAYGIAALTPWGAMLYGPATLHFQSAAMFAGLAAGTAVAGRAVAGNSFKKDRSGATAGSGQDSAFSANYGYGNQGGNNSNTSTFIRQSSGSQMQFTGLEKQITVLSESVGKLDTKLGSMKAGDVLVRAASERKGFIAETATKELSGNTTQATKMNRVLGN